MDETWIHHYTPESKQQSKQWTETRCSAPKKTRSVPSEGKVITLVFWDAEDILFIDYLEKGKTITGEYYSDLLTRLDQIICEKRPGLKKKIIFHQDNAPAHKSVLAMGKLRDLHYELLEHPPCSPDFTPSDFYLFPKQTLSRWSAFFFESRGDCGFRGVFCRSYEEPVQGRDNGAGASLE